MSLFTELKRRNVFRVGIAYLAASWLLIQVADILFPEFAVGVPVRVLAIALAVGLIPALVAAWVFELTPQGIKRDGEVDKSSSVSRPLARRVDRGIIVVLSLAVVVLLVDEFLVDRINPDLDKSIAVMPFADMSPAGDHAYFADGIAEEVLDVLAHLPGLRVISRNSSFALRDDGLSTPEVATKLSVAYVLEGSVRTGDDRIRVTAQLIEAGADKHLWSETYDSARGDMLDIQEQIARDVARALQIRLLTADSARFEVDPATYDLYLQGLDQLAQNTVESSRRAVDLFEEVVRAAPDFADAYANLAIALLYAGEPSNERIEMAANTALRIDSDNSSALAILGLAKLDGQTLGEGRRLLRQAIEANPNNPLAYRWLGTSYTVADSSRYYALANQALQVDPLNFGVLYHVSTASTRLGRYEEARRTAKRMYERGRQASGYGLAAGSYESEGLLDKALMTHLHTFRTDPAWPTNIFIAVTLMSLDELQLAQSWIDYLAASGLPDEDILQASSSVAYLRGDTDGAMQMVVNAHKSGAEISKERLAWLYMRINRDFESGLQFMKGALTPPGQNELKFDPELETMFTKYALALERTGRTAEAMELTSEILGFVDGQVALGAISAQFEHWQLVRARLHAIRGDQPSVLEALRLAADQGGLARLSTIHIEPFFDSMRRDPEFIEIIAAQEARNQLMRDNLQEQGMLLTPEQVLALREIPFDPFP